MMPYTQVTVVSGIALLIALVLAVLFGVLLWYVFRALRKYLRSAPERGEGRRRQAVPGGGPPGPPNPAPDDPGVCGGVPWG